MQPVMQSSDKKGHAIGVSISFRFQRVINLYFCNFFYFLFFTLFFDNFYNYFYVFLLLHEMSFEAHSPFRYAIDPIRNPHCRLFLLKTTTWKHNAHAWILISWCIYWQMAPSTCLKRSQSIVHEIVWDVAGNLLNWSRAFAKAKNWEYETVVRCDKNKKNVKLFSYINCNIKRCLFLFVLL